ncbi:histidine phosphatase family protein [Salipaludibacillus keqinensis]|uniref:Histidine phosphatase family protein n=1 Tax=Salipaludibacillus keqinensis TaxID=2045207 RepID=A0A323TSC5_9BACI|nr:histidine phosphatase family protein [Salipaludibacillus keqinensis]PYZ92315.1 histidine phosphatase family protein [Salipaludibacillus keqinensis]
MGTSHHLDLYLLRHGLTRWNVENRYLGHTDEPVMEIEELAELKKELEVVEFDEVFSSDLLRCKETIEYLRPDQPYVSDEGLREFHFGDWEGRKYEELKDIPLYRQWIDNWEQYRVPGGESGEEFSDRITGWLSEFLGKTLVAEGPASHKVLIVTHGGVIRLLLSILVEAGSFWSWRISHGEGLHLTLEYREERWTCSSLSVVPSQGNGRS